MSKPDWICSPGVVEETATGTVTKVGASGKGELKFAIEHSDPDGAVIECNGALHGAALGIGENYRSYEVVRKDPIRVTIVAGSDHVSIGPMSWANKKLAGGAPGFAVEHLRLEGVTVDGRFAQSPLSGVYMQQYGDIEFINMTLLSTPSKTKWGSRINGHARSLTAKGCTMIGGGIEHAFYWDNPTGEGSFVRIENCLFKGWKRTACQIVTRERPVANNPYVNPGAAEGDCIIDGNEARACGWEGSHNFTVTGWPNGTVFFRNNRGKSTETTGLFVSYKDFKQGKMLTPAGFQVARLVWKDNEGRYSESDRHMNMIGSVERLEIVGGNLKRLNLFGNKAAFQLDHLGANGSEEIRSRVDPNEWNVQTGQGPWLRGKTAFDPRSLWTDEQDA